MSINMADVKQIMHGTKEVIKIEDSGGNILWQKQSANTLTIVCTGTFNTNRISFYIVYKDSTDYLFERQETKVVNKDDIDYIAISHNPSSSNWYSAILENGSLVDSNITTTSKEYVIDITNVSELRVDINNHNTNYPAIGYIEKDNYTPSSTTLLYRTRNSSTVYVMMTLNGTNTSPSTLTTYSVADTATSTTLSFTARSSASNQVHTVSVYNVDATITSPNTVTQVATVDSPVHATYKYIAAQGRRTASAAPFATYIYVVGLKR